MGRKQNCSANRPLSGGPRVTATPGTGSMRRRPVSAPKSPESQGSASDPLLKITSSHSLRKPVPQPGKPRLRLWSLNEAWGPPTPRRLAGLRRGFRNPARLAERVFPDCGEGWPERVGRAYFRPNTNFRTATGLTLDATFHQASIALSRFHRHPTFRAQRHREEETALRPRFHRMSAAPAVSEDGESVRR